jgi:hypothetical protein
MKKLSLFLIVLITSCSTQKFYSENGRQISKKIYDEMRERRFNYVMKNMNDDDKSIIKTLKITKSVKDSLIETYKNY